MSAALASTVLLCLAAAPPTLVFEERVPLALLVNIPTGAHSAKLNLSQLIEEVDRLTGRHTDFVRLEVPAASVLDCHGALTCIVRRVRPDFLVDGPSPSEQRAALAARGERVPQHLLVVSTLTQAGESDRMSALYVDMDVVLGCAQAEPDAAKADLCANDAVRVRRAPERVDDATEALAYLDRLFTRHLEPELRASGHWEPFGRVEVAVNHPTAAIAVDGRPVGSTAEGAATIVNVPTGPHTLRASVADRYSVERSLVVDANAATKVQLEIDLASRAPRNAVIAGGIGLATIGAAITAWAAAYGYQHRQVYALCNPYPCSGPSFWTVEQMLRGDPPIGDGFPNQGHLRALPLGYSLVGMGGGMALGAWLFEEDENFPWRSVLAGVALGAASFTISTVAD